MKQSITPAAIKSSKNVFEQFRKAALEKEQREKALRMHQVEWNREWKAPQSSWYVAKNTFAEISFPQMLHSLKPVILRMSCFLFFFLPFLLAPPSSGEQK